MLRTPSTKPTVTLLLAALALSWAAGLVPSAAAQLKPRLKKVRANGVELSYVDQGKGTPVVFVHGGLVDYRRWLDQMGPFAAKYRVIAYSRRYNFPNKNPRVDPAYSAAVDAEDLAALIKKLKLGRVYVIGESYGAYAAMILAVRHPEVVRSLVLAEAPMLTWLNASPEGKVEFEQFQERLWQPVGRAFAAGDNAQALAVITAFFFDGAKVETVPPEIRAMVEQNFPEWQALTKSSDAFPTLRPEEVAAIRVPVLLMQGEKSLPLHRILDAQYAALLPNYKIAIVPNATHEMWDEQPAACREKSMEFLPR
ncbi:hypothetical protein AYO41_05005 [Verrucomicrobia bacterium SCGC AG-212-E04]|nr:hypothetical protein AYO41_05005 [Verrucomicrobia bacterium SCGC AG-212-E04]